VRVAWHYTNMTKIQAIVSSGKLRAKRDAQAAAGERAAVWFSTLPDWDPIANKGAAGATKGGGQVLLTTEQTEALTGGLWRVAVCLDDGAYLPWSAAPRALGMPKKVHRGMTKTALDLYGSDPKRYWFSMIDVEAERWRAIEFLDPATRQWTNVMTEEAAQ